LVTPCDHVGDQRADGSAHRVGLARLIGRGETSDVLAFLHRPTTGVDRLRQAFPAAP
jgi:hypothetical protein